MSHPFTLEYMLEGEASSSHIDVVAKSLKANQDDSTTYDSPKKSRPGTRFGESESVTNEFDPAEEDRNALKTIKEEMNITSTEDEGMSDLQFVGMAVRRRIEKFAEEVSIVGLSYLVKSSAYKVGSIIRKVIWTMLLLFGTGFMVFQIFDQISYYLTYPTIVNYRVAYNQSLRFPTVTICPEFLFSKKAVLSLGPEVEHLVSVRLPPYWDQDFGAKSGVYNFSALDLDWQFFYTYATIKAKDSILECSFGNLPCNASVVFMDVITDFGCCSQFNPVTTKYVTTTPGANYGLRLALWVNQSDCIITQSPAVGFRIVMHDPHDQPIVQSTGFRVGTGVSTSVSLTLRNVSMLPSPYGDCRQSENYTFMKCMKQCAGDFIVSFCKCRPFEFDVPAPLCSLDQYILCATSVLKLFITSGAVNECDCPLQCHQSTYPYSISSSPLSQQFLNYASQRSQFKGRKLSMSSLSKELVYLDIFYSQLNYVDIQTTPAYNLLTLVCDFGGTLGLILGGTMLTIIEILQCIVQLFETLVASARIAKMRRSLSNAA